MTTISTAPPTASPSDDAFGFNPLRAWIGVAILWMFYILSLLDRGVIALMVTPIMTELHITAVQVGVLQGLAFAAVYSVAVLPLGWAIDKAARRKILLAGILVWSAATLCCGLAVSFTQLTLARAFVGLGEAVLVPTALSLIADMFPRQRIATATAVFSSGATVGAGAALIVGGLLLRSFEEHRMPAMFGDLAPWRAVFITLGIAGVILAWLCLAIPDKRANARKNSPSPQPVATMAEFGQFLRKHAMLLSCIFIGFPLLVAGSAAFISWVPHHFANTYHWNARQTGLTLGTLNLIAAPLGVVAGGWAMDKALRAGIKAPYFFVPIITTFIGGPLLALGVVQTNSTIATALLGLGLFIYSAYASSNYVLVQILAPPSLRGRLASLQMLLLTLVGVSLGGLLPPLLQKATNTVGGNAGGAIAITMLSISVVVIITLTLGRGRLAAALAESADNLRNQTGSRV